MWLFNNTKQWKFLVVITAVAVLAVFVWAWSYKQEELPVARDFEEILSGSPSNSISPLGVSPADDINLAVPFAPQAPFANWEQPYQDACEEATLIMIDRYLRGVPLTLQEMDTEILRLVDWQDEHFGFNRDSNTAETARLAESYYPHLSARAVYDITADDIRVVLAEGTPVAVLVDGRKLGNPYYTAPGPDKHALVIKGVVGGKFITNDPGTKRGADFVYEIETVMNALVDYDGSTPGTGKRTMIVLKLTDS